MEKTAILKTTLTISMVLLAVLQANAFADGTYSGGTGEPNDPYLIATAADMNEIGVHPNDWNDCFLLTADINLADYNETNFNIIGNSTTKFTGIFDGNDYTISNFTWNSATTSYVGLFGYVDDPNAEIKDVRLIDPNVQGDSRVGALVGLLQAGTITGCGVEGGAVSGGDYYVGGLAGDNYHGNISNCYATGSVSGNGPVGGLVGVNNYYGTISNCYATGSVSGNDDVGGLAGYNCDGTISNCYATGLVTGGSSVGGLVGRHLYGTTSNCYATGNVTGGTFVGGLVGENSKGVTPNYYDPGTISNCYAAGDVSGNLYVGGLAGCNDKYGTILNCYAMGSVSGSSNIGGFAGYDSGIISVSFWDTESSGEPNGVGSGSSLGLTGKTTVQMHSMSTFFRWACAPAIWTIDDTNDYPHLAWENFPGEPISPVLSDFVEGSGTEEDPYLIYTPNDLDLMGWFSNEWNKHFKLMADIDLSGWSSSEPNLIAVFTGVFDGNDHTISNFTWNLATVSYVGLFGYVDDPNAEIKNLILIDPNIHGNEFVGALVGRLQDGKITGCGIEGGTVSGYRYVGGLAGYNWQYCTISNCFATGDVSGDDYVGGLVGNNSGGMVSNCYATGTVSGNDRVGGLAGYTGYGSSISGTISNCYATGSVSGDGYVGGLAGFHWNGTISNCYAAGSVSGWMDVGGLVGYNSNADIFASFWDTQTTGRANGIGYNYGDCKVWVYGKTTAQMYSMNTFLGWGAEPAIWTIDDTNDYPHLAWENSPGEPITLLSDLLEGSGTEQDPYLIYSPNDLDLAGLFSNGWGKHFKLMADIDLSSWSTTEPNIIDYFTGVFDGNDHSISNFTFQSPQDDYIGFFRQVDGPNAEIKNLRLIAPSVQGFEYVGTLVGLLIEGEITGCGVEGGTVSGYCYIGGLAGYNYYGTISNCFTTGSVSGDDGVGGLAGWNDYGIISNCYATDSVSGDVDVGGLAGQSYKGTILNCYATGSVSGNGYVGGLVGYNYSADIFASFWDTQTTGQANGVNNGGSCGTVEVYGRTTAQMQTQSTFTDYGWDFVGETINGPNDIWDICDGMNYPKLAWQIFLAGDFVCPDGVDFIDFAVFSLAWLSDDAPTGNWNPDCDISEPPDGIIDELDLAVFTDNWLQGL